MKSPLLFLFTGAALWKAALCIGNGTTSVQVPLVSPAFVGSIQLSQTSSDQPVQITFTGIPTSYRWSIRRHVVRVGPQKMTTCRQALQSENMFSGDTQQSSQSLPTPTQLADLLLHAFVLLDATGQQALTCASIVDATNRAEMMFVAEIDSSVVSGVIVVAHRAPSVHLAPQLSWHTRPAQPVNWALMARDTGSVEADCSDIPFAHAQSSSSSAFMPDSQSTISVGLPLGDTPLSSVAMVVFGGEANAPLYCTMLKQVRAKSAWLSAGSQQYLVSQQSPLHAAVISPPPLASMHIADRFGLDCNDSPLFRTLSLTVPVSTENTVTLVDQSLFGEDNLYLKTVRFSNPDGSKTCAVVQPADEATGRRARASFLQSVVGDITFYENQADSVLATGAIRHWYDLKPSEASWYLLDLNLKPTDDGSQFECPTQIVGKNLTEMFGVIDVAPYNADSTGPFMFRYDTQQLAFSNLVGRTLLIDLGWVKTCVNVAPAVPAEASASLKRYGLTRSPQLGSIEARDLVGGGGLLQVRLNKMVEQSVLDAGVDLTVHEHPVDLSVSSGSPCGGASVGPINDGLTKRLMKAIQQTGKVKREFRSMVDSSLLSGPNSLLGKTAVVKLGNNELICGTFDTTDENVSVMSSATFSSAWLNGTVQLNQRRTQTLAIFDTRSRATSIGWYVTRDDARCALDSSEPYNPTFIDTAKQLYKKMCSMTTPELCAIGDLLGKTGAQPADDRHSTLVPTTPLAGPYSVSNMTLVLYDIDQPEQRVCSTLQPMQTLKLTSLLVSSNVTRQRVQEEVAQFFEIETSRVAVSYNRTQMTLKCYTHQVIVTETTRQISVLKKKYDADRKMLEEKLHSNPLYCDSQLTGNGHQMQSVTVNLKPSVIFNNLALLMILLIWCR